MANDNASVWEALAENAPKIIGEAAQSGLGILALVILALAILAVVFFWKDTPGIRLGVFGVLLFTFVGLSLVAVYEEAGEEALGDQDNAKPISDNAAKPVHGSSKSEGKSPSFGDYVKAEREKRQAEEGADQ